MISTLTNTRFHLLRMPLTLNLQPFTSLDAAMKLLFHVVAHSRGASELIR